MAEFDLSLSDALTDSVPQTGPESLVERDFVAQLEAETFDDKVGETVGKTDYIPLLDKDDARPDAGTALENGEQEAHGVQKPGCQLTAGTHTSLLRPEPHREVCSLDQQQASATDFLSGFSQPDGMGVNLEVGAAPLSAQRVPSVAEPQQPTPSAEASKEHSVMLPEPQAPRSPLDLSAGALGYGWPDQAGCLPTDLPFTPSVSTVISRHAGHLAVSPDDPPDSWPSRESTAYAGGDERDGEGSDKKQRKKKKRRQKDEGSYENLETRGHPELQGQGENILSAEEVYQRIGPRRDRGEGGWEEQLGKSGGRGKRGKSRKKLPEEWGVMPEPITPVSAATSQITEEGMMDVGSSVPANLEASFMDIDTNQRSWKKEVNPEEGRLVPSLMSQDLLIPSAPSINPVVLNSELKATAPPFTMPSNSATLGSFPMAAQPGDTFDLLIDTENASLGDRVQAFLPPFSPGNEAISGDMVDSGMFDNTSSLQESCVQDMPEGDTSAFSPASQPSPGIFPKSEVLASAPPLSPSDASWLLNDSHVSSNSELFDFSDMSTSGHPLTLGLSLDTPSPAPLRSPKTTAQEFQPSQHKDVKSAQKESKKSSSSPSVKTPTSPGDKNFPKQASPGISPSSPPSVNPLGVPGSGLNPAAKPFFPSFADPMEEPVVPPVNPVIEDMTEKADKKVEKLGDNAKNADLSEPLKKDEQKSVKVEFASNETPTKAEKETEKEKRNETQKEEVVEGGKVKDKEEEKMPEKEKVVEKEKEKEVENMKEKEIEKIKEKEKEMEKVKEKEKEVEMMKPKEEKEAEKVKEEKETDRVKETEKQAEMVKETNKVDEPEKLLKVELTEKVESKVEKTESVEKVDKIEKPEVGDKTEGKNTEKLEKPEMKDGKEQHVDKVEKVPEQQPTHVTFDSSHDEQEKKADTEAKAAAKVEETKKEEADSDKTKKMEKEEDKVEKPPEKPAEKTTQKNEKEEKQDKTQANKKVAEKKDNNKGLAAKTDGEKRKSKPATNGSSAISNKDVASADKKTKPAAGATKPSPAAKTRPSTATAGGSVTAPAKRPTSATTPSTSDKNSTTARASSTAAAGPKRALATSTSRTASSTTNTTHDAKPKTTTEKRPLVPKASTNQTGSTAATKNGTATTAASKAATSVRTAASVRTTTAAAAKKPLTSKTDSKPGEEKRPGTGKSSTVDSNKPKTTTTTTRSSVTTTAASRTRTAAAKPTTPSTSTATVPEKKPPVPRAPRPTSATTTSTTTATSRTTARPGTAPAPDIRNARSKIGSTDNMKHQPGGGKVSSASQSRGVASAGMSQGKVQIRNKKVDLSKVTSKCGSKDNIKHKPGGGDVKIETHKVSFREKAQPKVGSMDNVSHSPGGGNVKAEGAQETTEGNGTPLSGTMALAQGSEPGQAGSPAAQENGLKDGAPCDSEGPREPQALDSNIPETSI